MSTEDVAGVMLVFVTLSGVVLLGIGVAYQKGHSDGCRAAHQAAVDAGVAQWDADSTGVVSIKWLEIKQ